MFRKKKPKEKLSKGEKIRLGYEKKWKIVLPCILILVFIIMSSFTYVIRMTEPKATHTRLSKSLQHAVYNSARTAENNIKSKALELYPLYETDPVQKKEYTDFIRKYTDIAFRGIKKHFNITTKEYGQIVLKGHNEGW